MPAPIRRSHDLRSENRRRVIQSLRTLGPCARSALGDATGLSQAAISSFASELITEGVVTATRRAVSRGRPQSVLDLSPTAATMVTVSLSIDLLELQLIDYRGEVLDRSEYELDTRAFDEQGLIICVVDAIEALVAQAASPPLQHVAVGFQGITGHGNGELIWSPILSIGRVPLGQAIKDHFGIQVSVSNDCRLIANALRLEKRKELGKSFATVLFSHGVGLALTLNDAPLAGISTSAMEFGHLQHEYDGAPCRCGQRGCIEAYAADYAIARSIEQQRKEATANGFSQATSGRLPSGILDQEALAASTGDPCAIAAFDAAGSAIGCGLRELFLLLGPMPVALVGRSPAVLDAMRPKLVAALEAASAPSQGLVDVPLLAIPDDTGLLSRGLVYNAQASVDKRLASVDSRTVDQDLLMSAHP